MEFSECHAVCNLLKRQRLGGTQALLTLQLHSLVGDIAGFLLRLHNVEGVSCLRCAVETEYDNRLSGLCLLYVLVALVEHSLYPTPRCSGYHDVADLQRSVADEDRRDVSTTLIQ